VSWHCLDKYDKFGYPIDMSIHGNFDIYSTRHLNIGYRPCIPKQRTPFNSAEKCLIDDVNDEA
jgi:hypothetical protein